MKTAEQVLTEAYAHAPADGRDYNHTWIIEAMHAFAREACEVQRDNCADAYIESANQHGNYTAATDRAITYAPQPKGV